MVKSESFCLEKMSINFFENLLMFTEKTANVWVLQLRKKGPLEKITFERFNSC